MTRNKTLTLSVLATVALLSAAAVRAQPGPHRGPGAFGGPPGLGMALLHGPLGDRLDLDESQRETIRGILETEHETMGPWIEDLKTVDDAMEEAVEADPFDEEAVRAAARQAADIRVELAVARARVASRIRDVLSPDQRELLGELKAERRAMGRHPGGRFGPGGPGGPGEGRGPRGPRQ